MSATALPALLDSLVSALQARPGLTGVNVFSAPVTPQDMGEESIMFAGEVEVTQEPAAMSSTHIAEEFGVDGIITCFAPMAASSGTVATLNAAAKTVRDRACAILEEVTDELASDMTVDGSVLGASIDSLKFSQGIAPEGQLGRWASVEFTVSVEAHTTP